MDEWSYNQDTPATTGSGRGPLKIPGILLCVFSGLVFIFSLGAIITAWAANGVVTERLTSEVASIHADLTAIQSALGNARQELETAKQIIDVLQGILQAAGINSESNAQVLTDIVDKVDNTLTPLIDKASGAVGGVQDALQKVKETIDSLNNLPLVNIEIPGLELVENLSSDLETLEGNIDEVNQRVQDITGLTREMIEAGTTGFADLEASVDGMLAMLDEYEPMISDRQAQLTQLLMDIPGWIDWLCVGISLVMLWMAFSQAGLFAIGWSLYNGEFILKNWL
jgi:PAS domain-containing protein